MSSAAKSVTAGLACSVVFMFALCCICNPTYVGSRCEKLLMRVGIQPAPDLLAGIVVWKQNICPMLFTAPEHHGEPFCFSCTLNISPPQISPDNLPPLRLVRVTCGDAIFEVTQAQDVTPDSLGLFVEPDTGDSEFVRRTYAIYEASLQPRTLDTAPTARVSSACHVLSKGTDWRRKIPISVSCTAPDEDDRAVATYSMQGVEGFSMVLEHAAECESISVEAAVGGYDQPGVFCVLSDLEIYGQPIDMSSYRADWDGLDLATIGDASDLYILACPAGIEPPPLGN